MHRWRPFAGSLCLLALTDAVELPERRFAEELELDAIAHPLRRRQALAVRELARTAMRELGLPAPGIARVANGAPQWPSTLVGSLAHDASHLAAMIAPSTRYSSIGVDVEPLLPLPEDAAALVVGQREHAALARMPGGYARWSRALFGAKECVHKALNPLTGVFLEFDEVEIQFLDGGDSFNQPSMPSFRVKPLSATASDAAQLLGRVWFTDAAVVTAAAILR